jgi:hypothetical protein
MIAAAADVVKFVDVDLAAKGVAVDAEDFGGAGLVAVESLKHALDEFLLEFSDGFFEENAALNHHTHEGFQLIFHSRTLRSNDPGA